MSRRFTYSRAIETNLGVETFTAVEFDSYDEAIKAVEKGIYDRHLSIKTAEDVIKKAVELSKPIIAEEELKDLPTAAATPTTSRPVIKK